MTKLNDPKAIRRNILLLAAAYFVSYLTRINFGAVIYEMVQDTGFAKAELSAAVTGAFITYGAGQFLSGWLGDRMQPKILMLGGLLLSSAMNLLIPFCPTPAAMTAVWCVNGFAQAFMWPPLVRLMACLFHEDDYRRCTVRVHWAASFGTILLYLISPVLIGIAGWRTVFCFSALSGLVMAAFWMKFCVRVDAPQKAAEKKSSGSGAAAILFAPMMLAVMVAIVLMGALRDGVTTWMPTYIGETYNLGTGVATLTGVAMPLFGIGCQQLASLLYKKMKGSPLATSVALTSLAFLATLILVFTTGRSAVLSVFGAALLTGAMHGTNMTLISFLPSHFRNTGFVSTISGVLNACVYIGSALSTYGFAALSESAGWSATILLWVALAAGCGLICLFCIPTWNRRFANK